MDFMMISLVIEAHTRLEILETLFWPLQIKIVNSNSNYHPEHDNQPKHTNQILEQYLRCYINYQPEDWVDYSCLVEFA